MTNTLTLQELPQLNPATAKAKFGEMRKNTVLAWHNKLKPFALAYNATKSILDSEGKRLLGLGKTEGDGVQYIISKATVFAIDKKELEEFLNTHGKSIKDFQQKATRTTVKYTTLSTSKKAI